MLFSASCSFNINSSACGTMTIGITCICIFEDNVLQEHIIGRDCENSCHIFCIYSMGASDYGNSGVDDYAVSQGIIFAGCEFKVTIQCHAVIAICNSIFYNAFQIAECVSTAVSGQYACTEIFIIFIIIFINISTRTICNFFRI